MKFLVVFFLLSLVNVIFSTVRSLVTIKSGKTLAALISGGYFAFYNIMLIYTVADFPLWQKCLITFVCNVIGVWVVKFFEEKRAPVKMWKLEMAVITNDPLTIKNTIEEQGIPCNYIPVGNWTMFNCYCDTCEQSKYVKNLCKSLNGKISAYESKPL